jgi:hypothetical protein
VNHWPRWVEKLEVSCVPAEVRLRQVTAVVAAFALSTAPELAAGTAAARGAEGAGFWA